MKIALISIFCIFFGYSLQSSRASSAAVKRPRVLPPMFLPTYGKRSWLQQEGGGEQENDDDQPMEIGKKKAPNPYPLPPFVVVTSNDGQSQRPQFLRRQSRRPPTTLPVMKRIYVEMEPAEEYYQRYQRRPPTTLPVMKREWVEVDIEPMDSQEFARHGRRPPTTLPVMKRGQHYFEFDPYADDDSFQRFGRRPPTTLPVMKRKYGGYWVEVEDENDDQEFTRQGRRPPTTLPVMKREAYYYEPSDAIPFQRYLRRPPTTLPVMKREWIELDADTDRQEFSRQGRKVPPAEGWMPPVLMRMESSRVDENPTTFQRFGRRPPTTLPVMKRNYWSDMYAADKLGEEEYYKK